VLLHEFYNSLKFGGDALA